MKKLWMWRTYGRGAPVAHDFSRIKSVGYTEIRTSACRMVAAIANGNELAKAPRGMPRCKRCLDRRE